MEDFLLEMQESFLIEADEFLERAEIIFIKIEKNIAIKDDFDSLKRIFHNLKGSGKAVSFDHFAVFCHEIENLIVAMVTKKIPITTVQLLLDCNDQLKKEVLNLKKDHTNLGNFTAFGELLTEEVKKLSAQKAEEVSLPNEKEEKQVTSDDAGKGSGKRIDEILDLFSEQIIYLANSSISALNSFRTKPEDSQFLMEKTIASLQKLSYDIQKQTLSLRMVGLKGLKSKLDRVVRDTCRETQKEVSFIFEGLDQELDKAIVDQLADPLMHMIRNSIDHGIESSDQRLKLGKSANGTITINAKREGLSFVIQMHDDGRGLSREKIYQKALEKGLITGTPKMTDEEIFELIFENGFSTKDTASQISGRGVGMNVVKEMVLRMKGSYEVESTLNQGTTFKINLPLSLSIFSGMLVKNGQERFVIPSLQIREIISSREIALLKIDGNKEAIQVRGEIIEVRCLFELLHQKKKPLTNATSVYIIASIARKRFALRVDQMINIQKIIPKPLSEEMRVCPGASGMTILDDEGPIIVLDLNMLYKDEYMGTNH